MELGSRTYSVFIIVMFMTLLVCVMMLRCLVNRLVKANCCSVGGVNTTLYNSLYKPI